jgi:hypothetical protein
MTFLRKYNWVVLALCVGYLYGSCSEEPPPSAETEASPDGISASSRWMAPEAVIKPGAYPLWFELSQEGPKLVNSPQEASLTPFEPWPLARFITGFITQEDRLIGAVNRSGFLVLIPGEGGLLLYSVTDTLGWEPYTAASLFLYQKIPAVLLYRNVFFADSRAASPVPPVRGLVKGSRKPAGISLPALKNLPAGESWETDALRRGKDGYWYYRSVNREKERAETVYYRSRDLTGPGELTSAGAFRSASEPSPLTDAPEGMGKILEEAFRLSGPGTVPIAAVSFAESGEIRYFSETPPHAGPVEGLAELVGYYSPADSYGLALWPGGKGVYGKFPKGTLETGAFTLPALPEKFSYTGIGRSGSALIALWEEREDLNVGAAGFMVIYAP